MHDRYRPIEDYGIIGDLHTVALVSTVGSIDFMCFPRFDSPSVFAALLDRQRGGHFSITPTDPITRSRQMYLPGTNVLVTRFFSESGLGEVTDFMPVEEAGRAHHLVRRVHVVRGRLRFRMELAPRFDYGRAPHAIQQTALDVRFSSRGEDATCLRLRVPAPVRIENGAAVTEFTLEGGQELSFVLDDGDVTDESPHTLEDYVQRAHDETVDYWRRWLSRSTYRGRWREMVDRSALVLKLLVSRQHGSIVAAPTFSLPETIGGQRNWDYRFTWIRDASFTLHAFLRLGFHEEAAEFFRWTRGISDAGGPMGPLQVLYDLEGKDAPAEQALDHFEGYRGSRPVRIGNAAQTQLQLDIYGELMGLVDVHDLLGEPMHHDLWLRLTERIDWVCSNWERADAGIWEVRGDCREFLYSRVMCWVALDRGLAIAARRSMPAPWQRWRETRDAIYRDVFANFWSEKKQAFTQAKGSDALDASALIMPVVRMVAPTDPRWLSTLKAIEEELVEDALVYRYQPDRRLDGQTRTEGSFSICSFWYVECLSRAGQVDKARFTLEKMLGYSNHLGLFSEELGPCGEHLGNFPQALTHLSLISAACDLDERLSCETVAPAAAPSHRR